MHGLPRMDTDQLLAFQRVVRDGSFSRAAAALGIGQPAISARIQTLEAAVGGALFTRGRRVALTPLGHSFLAYAGRALEVLAAGVDDARELQGGGRGRIALGALTSIMAGLVAPAFTSLVSTHPDLTWLIRSGDHELVLGLLWDRVLDFGLLLWPSHEATAAHLAPLLQLREPILIAASPRHPIAAVRQPRRADLVRLARPFLRLRWWHAQHPELDRITQEAGAALEIPLEVGLPLVLEGRAVGAFPRTLIGAELARGALTHIEVTDLAPLYRGLGLVRRDARAPLSPAASHLIAALTEQARSLGLLLPEAAGRPRSPKPAARPGARPRTGS
jgi:DNA-binding transcriptional LysR family regulator